MPLDYDPAFWVASGLDPQRVAVLADDRAGRLTGERNSFAAKGLEEKRVGGEVHDPRCVAVASVELHVWSIAAVSDGGTAVLVTCIRYRFEFEQVEKLSDVVSHLRAVPHLCPAVDGVAVPAPDASDLHEPRF